MEKRSKQAKSTRKYLIFVTVVILFLQILGFGGPVDGQIVEAGDTVAANRFDREGGIPSLPGQLNGKISLGLPVTQGQCGRHALLVHRLVEGQHESLVEQDAG